MKDESSHARRYSARYSDTKAILTRARSTPTFSGCGKSWKGIQTIQYTFARCVAQATSLCHSPEVRVPAGVLASLVTLCGTFSKPLPSVHKQICTTLLITQDRKSTRLNSSHT